MAPIQKNGAVLMIPASRAKISRVMTFHAKFSVLLSNLGTELQF